MWKRLILVIGGIFIGIGVGYKLWGEEQASLRFMLDLFTQVLRQIETNYVVEKDPADLVKSGIEGMVNSLDPFSEFLTPTEGEEWEIRTQGEFGGLGMQIGIRDDFITVIAPIEGTPASRAGIRPGDKIIEIQGESTLGMKLNDAVKRLRGTPGTEVSFKVIHGSLEEPIEYTLTREIIHIKSVPYYSLLDSQIGYLSFASFSKNSAQEVKNALDTLFMLGAKKIILDLRNNPGGLLEEAVEVTELFLPKGSLIVTTKGRREEEYQNTFSSQEPVHDSEYPLLVLTNTGSASGSEILAGAIQDWDRGVILGDTSFGKGSVQRIFKLNQSYQTKLTIAKYYTPAGRSIHRENDKKEPPDGLVYHTRNLKREITGGGGIIPDLVIEAEDLPSLVAKAYSKDLFFAFAVEYGEKHKKPSQVTQITITDTDLEKFKNLMEKKEIKFKSYEFDEVKDLLKYLITQEIAQNYWGVTGKYTVALKQDPLVQKAQEILSASDNLAGLFKVISQK